VLAACLYLGSGVGLLLLKGLQRASGKTGETEAPLDHRDFVWLAGAILTGGVAAPIVLLVGLRHTPAATASLLLNFESVATTLVAALVFKEAIDRRAGWAIVCITLASILLSLNLSGEWGFSVGAIGVLAACALWGVDNNLTRNISAKDPLTIVMVKGLGAGAFSLALALVLGRPSPVPATALKAMAVGSLSYGLSIVLFVRAMREMGAARTSALYGTAPLAGVALSLLLLSEVPTAMFLVALPIMIAGAILLLSEQHEHSHIHEAAVHDHCHQHDDEHHIHEHVRGKLDCESRAHSHLHCHHPFEHAHFHLPDIHHRHSHPAEA
jgi:drug/metabolite transporter (DMT)-like permease